MQELFINIHVVAIIFYVHQKTIFKPIQIQPLMVVATFIG